MKKSRVRKTSGLAALIFLAAGFFIASPAQAAPKLAGRILLQVQDKGQAWYVSPVDQKRYYLGRPEDAFLIMKSLGLGVADSDFKAYQGYGPGKLAGRILLQVQDKGQAWYVSPVDRRLHYLGRPADAFSVMRSQGLGITTDDLARIPIGGLSPDKQTIAYPFKFQNVAYSLSQELSPDLYEKYRSSAKILTYSSTAPPANLRDAFYQMFLTARPEDRAVAQLASGLKKLASQSGWGSDQLAELALALVQYMPYDQAKLSQDDNRNTNPYYPYETLFLNRGVCSDKTFLAVALLRELGYGAAILDFPDSNHSAVGIACPVEESLAASGYCYAETTNYFPVGVVPQNLSSGQAQAATLFNPLFTAGTLGRLEIYQASSGLEYRGLAATKSQVQVLKKMEFELQSSHGAIKRQEDAQRQKEAELVAAREQLSAYLAAGQTVAYNQLVPEYNRLVGLYNSSLAAYQEAVSAYNQQAGELSRAIKEFYQQ